MTNPDLQKERDSASFNVESLTNILDGGPEKTLRRKKLEHLTFKEPAFDSSSKIYESFTERYDSTSKRRAAFDKFKEKHNLSSEDADFVKGLLGSDLGLAAHDLMFVTSIERLGTDEQKDRWLAKAKSHQILGTYAQTELGHGTSLQNLETTATYDLHQQDFVLNTPFPSGMKFWPGTLGKTANFAIVMANLYCDGKSCGMQPFVVQIRDLKTHQPLPGIEVGSIGPIFTRTSLDNGYLILKNIRVPRTNMLMKYAQVSEDGKFMRTGDPRINYAAMVLVRVVILKICYTSLSMASTIATRYSAVRRQSELKPGEREPQILDYQTQQHKLFPCIAASYALFFAKESLQRAHDHIFHTEIPKGNFSGMAELHVTSSGLKAFGAEMACEGIEICRRACGGHGYLLASGLPSLIMNASQLPTVEGENTVLYLQVARYLMKACVNVNNLNNGKPIRGIAGYLRADPGPSKMSSQQDFLDITQLLHAFQARAYRQVNEVVKSVQKEIQRGSEHYLVWNSHAVLLVEAAKAHCEVTLVQNFVDSLRQLSASSDIIRVLTTMCQLYAVHRIIAKYGDFLRFGVVNKEQLEVIQSTEFHLLSVIRPDAVPLVDAHDWHDMSLNSALGAFDGNVYQRLYESARKAPINNREVHPAGLKDETSIHEKAKL